MCCVQISRLQAEIAILHSSTRRGSGFEDGDDLEKQLDSASKTISEQSAVIDRLVSEKEELR